MNSAITASLQNARIIVHTDQITNRISRYMTGVCMEDVNHEVYGGIYSQMIFGESFQEPAPSSNLKGFSTYGAGWIVYDGELRAAPGNGTKVVSNYPPFSDGEVSVDILLPDQMPGNVGLILRVTNPGTGIDSLTGYNIALDSSRNTVQLNYHNDSFETLEEAPYKIPVNQWISLTVRMTGSELDIFIDDELVMSYKDDMHPLPAGMIGFKTWRREARFRNFRVQTDDGIQTIPFEPADIEGDEISSMWSAVRKGSVQGTIALDRENPFSGRQSQRISFEECSGEIGIANKGLNHWGMNFIKDREYEGCLWVRPDRPADICVSLESADGSRIYTETRLSLKGSDWQKLDFVLKPDADDAKGRFAIKLKSPGAITIGYAFLQPGLWGRYKGLPVRRDIAESMISQGLTVLRYGGAMINNPQYRWKNMIGPRDKRPPYTGSFYLYSSNGFGIIDFINYCEAAGFLGIPVFCMDETPEDMADFIEYANGPAESEWGQRRVQDGHPKPYNLKYIQLGNEEIIDDSYWQRFKPLAEAVWANDPGITIIIGDYSPDTTKKVSLTTYKNILELAKEHDREVWFDLHLLAEGPEIVDEQTMLIPKFIKELQDLCPGARFKLVVFEFNSNTHDMRRALGNAQAINELERLGDDVLIACSANALQPYRQNDDVWDQGLLFFTPTQTWGQPSYYITQMISESYLPYCVRAEVESPDNSLDVTAKVSDDKKTVQIQAMNPSDKPVQAEISLMGFTPANPEAKVTKLSGNPGDINTPQNPENIIPKRITWKHGSGNGRIVYTFEPYSFTVIRFE